MYVFVVIEVFDSGFANCFQPFSFDLQKTHVNHLLHTQKRTWNDRNRSAVAPVKLLVITMLSGFHLLRQSSVVREMEFPSGVL
ncbi:hypothetical protein R6Q57_016895 [Mikania cordata]